MSTKWRESSLFMYMKELTDQDYNEMMEYVKNGGTLTEDDIIARNHYEKYYKNRRKKSVNLETNIEETDEQ